VKRVAIVGPGGAGKSTFATELGSKTGLPVIHLDQYFWRPGWVETPREEWELTQADLVAMNQWILEGNYAGTFDLRFERADTVIIFGLPRRICIARAVRRSLRRGAELQAPGCPNRFDWSFYRWIWLYPKVSRPRLDEALARHSSHLLILELRTRDEVRRLLSDVGAALSGSGSNGRSMERRRSRHRPRHARQ
jgi:adenylate kinase family enzyme